MSHGLRSFVSSLALVALVSGFISACGKKKGSHDVTYETFGHSPYDLPSSFFSSGVTEFVVEVDYEVGPTPTPPAASAQGAEPYVGVTQSGLPYWNIFENNLKKATQSKNPVPTVIVPKTMAEMHPIPYQNKQTWTPSEIYNLAESIRTQRSTSNQGVFFILFLAGYLDDENSPGSPNPNVIGVSLSGTTIIAIFKPVVRSSGNQSGLVPIYVEQSTMVHEVGHALGLVNNGLPMLTSHQDSSHGAHCSNPNCTMYWENEGIANLKSFLQRVMLPGGSTTLFGSECLNDLQNYHP